SIDPDNPDDMLADKLDRAVQIFAASPVLACKQYRKDYLASLPADHPDPKQAMIDHVMEQFDVQHAEIAKLL
ncbi:MAG: 1-acyl-sn-glycerol-3-phosphate acyltransferase, partial [Treponemataceae bacterium]|nr:1-acyl-sn-glycerol-3-phosphate acyltransferase [Treponemataceae bacterium]